MFHCLRFTNSPSSACPLPVSQRIAVITITQKVVAAWCSLGLTVFCPCLCHYPPGVVKMRRGLTARVFDECDGLVHLYSWFITLLQQLQEKAIMEVDKADPTREVSRAARQQTLHACSDSTAHVVCQQPH